ncbi:hypothetical protein [Limosilactobacillus galli]|uniref:hypothetical protein n=1 Tax=Limosilactobacillus galli TaxID=2991834 RepID=UPI0024B9C422|nr:hypothetical protein [Limosilactobacillus galli]
MNEDIASKEEVIVRMDSLEVLQQFLKDNHIQEHSKTGQLLSQLQTKTINRILSDSRIRIASK